MLVDEANERATPEAIRFLWEQVRIALYACGDPSPRDIDRLAASFGLKLPSSTVEGWFKTWSVVPTWEKFDVLVKALGAEHDRDWKALHAAAQLADRHRRTARRRQDNHDNHDPPAHDGPDTDTADESPDQSSEPRPIHITVGVTHVPEIKAQVTHLLDRRSVILIAVAALILIAGAALLTASSPNRPGMDTRANTSPVLTPSPTERPSVPGWPFPTRRQLESPPPAPAGTPKVIYVGDSIATESRRMVSYFVHHTRKAQITAVDHPGTAICDYLTGDTKTSRVPQRHKLPALVKRVKPRIVVLQFWGVSTTRTPCTRGARPGGDDYFARYRADAERAARQITEAAREAGVPRPRLVWVLQGPDRTKPDRVQRLNEEIYTEVARLHDDLVSDAGWFVSWAADLYGRDPGGRYRWLQFLPCTALERKTGYCSRPEAFGGVTALHEDDENVRYCLGELKPTPRPCRTKSPGIARYSKAIAHTIIQALE